MKAKALLFALGLSLGLAGTATAGDWRGGVWVYQPSDGYRPPPVHRYDPRSPYSHYPRYRQNLPQDNRAYVPRWRHDNRYPQPIRPGQWAQSRPDYYDRPGRHDPNDRWRGDKWRDHDWRREPPRSRDHYRGYSPPGNTIYYRHYRD